MTTVVAAAVDGKVFMAADSATNVYERPVVGGIRKLLRLKAGALGEVLLGVAGAGGLPGCIQASLQIDSVPLEDEDVDAWAHAIACAITEIATEAGLLEDGSLSGSVLLGWNGHLWTLGHACACAHPDGRAAIGSGEGPAMGALDVLLDDGADPAYAVVRATQAGIRLDRFSEGPVNAEVLGPADEDDQ
ncbi:hypothetical protein [Micromonospora maritima]|uniref:hypothetical protein n=1 Tax=Micromonospora maritima TaxID=986711 RepID=UPI00157CB376|nr:hypothetical protein [Micromonospora maritima]